MLSTMPRRANGGTYLPSTLRQTVRGVAKKRPTVPHSQVQKRTATNQRHLGDAGTVAVEQGLEDQVGGEFQQHKQAAAMVLCICCITCTPIFGWPPVIALILPSRITPSVVSA
jgi:hypothetical protein